MRFKKALEVMILLPAACPAYLVAYAYTDFLNMLALFKDSFGNYGMENSKRLLFPRNKINVWRILVLSFVLYPYVYLLARTGFLNTSEKLVSVAKIYNRSEFWSVCLPLSRPAIMVGLSLVSMEVISDFGTVEYFSLQTLTLGIFNVWIGLNDIAAAAQMSLFTFFFIILLLFFELKSRGGKNFSTIKSTSQYLQTFRPRGIRKVSNYFIVLLPIFLGFLFPVIILFSNMIGYISNESFWRSVLISVNTFSIAGISAITIMTTATLLGTLNYILRNRHISFLTNLASAGYAFPGTMLAIGVIIFIGQVESISSFYSQK